MKEDRYKSKVSVEGVETVRETNVNRLIMMLQKLWIYQNKEGRGV
jgi:hypothetical protein